MCQTMEIPVARKNSSLDRAYPPLHGDRLQRLDHQCSMLNGHAGAVWRVMWCGLRPVSYLARLLFSRTCFSRRTTDVVAGALFGRQCASFSAAIA